MVPSGGAERCKAMKGAEGAGVCVGKGTYYECGQQDMLPLIDNKGHIATIGTQLHFGV